MRLAFTPISPASSACFHWLGVIYLFMSPHDPDHSSQCCPTSIPRRLAPAAPKIEKVSARALAVWLTGCVVYVTAFTGRTSFGVAGVAAIERFSVDASALAVFTSVQVGVYAFAQVPMGVLIDRLGPKKMLFYGALIMALGQIILGLTTNYGVAIAARVLIGLGDATAFLSVMRLLPLWFPLKKAPFFGQITGTIGQLGQFLSAVPFLFFLNSWGWTWAFVSLGAVGVLVAGAAWLVIADSPVTLAKSDLRVTESLRIIVRDPFVWQAFFTHWTSMVVLVVFSLLWGAPLMKLALGLSPAEVGMIFSVSSVITVLSGPIHGVISQRLGRNREWYSVGAGLIAGGVSIWFFIASAPRGIVALCIFVGLLAFFITGSGFGFDTVRENVDVKVIAAATGLANMGGFVSTMIAAQLVGALLSVSEGYGWDDFAFAWWAVTATWAVGMGGFAVAMWKVRRRPRPHPERSF
ncbi:putative sulfoacetate transporter SauU [Corynebacterium felinum]|nr:putative sulfoacetate transporter SauU [Corynebacterium felinum]